MSANVLRTRLSSILAALLALATLTACGSSSDSTGTGGAGGTGGAATSTGTGGMPQAAEPSAATKAIWAQIQGYSSWPTFAENPSPKMSDSHMKMFVVSHYNDVVGAAITSKTLPLPDGAIIVKDNFMMASDTAPMAVTVMAKQAGKWYWVEAMPDGMVMLDPMGKPLEGDVAMCTGCHSSGQANDFVLTHDFSQ